MDSTNDFTKKKNMLDLEYQTNLAYFNIASISLVTSLFATFLAFASGQISKAFLVTAVISEIVIFVPMVFYLLTRLGSIVENIRNLN